MYKMYFKIIVIILIFFIISYINGENRTLSFCVISDVHYCDCEPKADHYYGNSLNKLESCFDTLKSKNVDFGVQLGDLIDRDKNNFKNVLPIFNQLNIPYYHVVGNSDYNFEESSKKKILGILGLKNTFYSFELNNWIFVILDGNDLSFHAVPKDDTKYMEVIELFNRTKESELLQAKDWNGGIGREQLKWLDTNLIVAEKNKKNVIIFCHFPVLPYTKHILWNNDEVVNLITSYSCVKAYVSGHNHRGNYIFQNNIHFLTLKAMIETPNENSFAIFEIYKDNIKINGFGREIDRILKLN